MKLKRMDKDVLNRLYKVLRNKAKKDAVLNKGQHRSFTMRSNAMSLVSGMSSDDDNETSRNKFPTASFATVQLRSGRAHTKSVNRRNANYMNATINKEIEAFAKFGAEPELSPRFKTPCPRPDILCTRHGHTLSYRDP